MKKTTKGALAAGAAAVLLLGGAGSLAFWTDEGAVAGGTIETGFVTLGDGTCAADWVYANGSDAGGTVDLLVPGDQITRDCTFPVDGAGDHLTANLTVPSDLDIAVTSTPAPTTDTITAAATFDYGTTTGITSGQSFAVTGPTTLTAHVVVTFPYGDATTINADDTQNLVGSLDQIQVSLTQDQSSGANPN